MSTARRYSHASPDIMGAVFYHLMRAIRSLGPCKSDRKESHRSRGSEADEVETRDASAGKGGSWIELLASLGGIRLMEQCESDYYQLKSKFIRLI